MDSRVLSVLCEILSLQMNNNGGKLLKKGEEKRNTERFLLNDEKCLYKLKRKYITYISIYSVQNITTL